MTETTQESAIRVSEDPSQTRNCSRKMESRINIQLNKTNWRFLPTLRDATWVARNSSHQARVKGTNSAAGFDQTIVLRFRQIAHNTIIKLEKERAERWLSCSVSQHLTVTVGCWCVDCRDPKDTVFRAAAATVQSRRACRGVSTSLSDNGHWESMSNHQVFHEWGGCWHTLV